MTPQQQTLWFSIQNFELDDPRASFTFTDRLAKENGWTLEYALRATEEYKKFIFLMCIAEHPLTPSDQVDQVWHLHLLYTRSYWIDLCANTLKKEIHHGPTAGGAAEKDKFENWYDKTLTLYAETFSLVAPVDLWPISKVRFNDVHYVRINTRKNWIVAKPSFLQL
jgi:hypothetical protein